MRALTPAEFAAHLGRLDAAAPLVLAVSGGGDSAAMLHLAARSPLRDRIALVATVDHGLRPAAAGEARAVAGWCAALNLDHRVLAAAAPLPATGVQEAARRLRHRLLTEAARPLGAAIVLAHTLDDQAETLLMRLARGSGVDGLSAMAPRTVIGGTMLLRPLLDTSRDDLRNWLRARRLPWFDDPSNDDAHHERVRVRRAIAALELDPLRLARTARLMRQAREALEGQAQILRENVARDEDDGVLLSVHPLADAPREVALRVLAAALSQVSGRAQRPRLEALERAFDWMISGEAPPSRTLHGCLVRRCENGRAHITVEPPRGSAVKEG